MKLFCSGAEIEDIYLDPACRVCSSDYWMVVVEELISRSSSIEIDMLAFTGMLTIGKVGVVSKSNPTRCNTNPMSYLKVIEFANHLRKRILLARSHLRYTRKKGLCVFPNYLINPQIRPSINDANVLLSLQEKSLIVTVGSGCGVKHKSQ